MAWYENKYGWKQNPFNIKPNPETLVGYKETRQKCFQYIQSGDAFHIKGPIGTGKTTLAKWIAETDHKLQGNHQIQYFDAETLEKADLNDNLLTKITSKFKGNPKKVVLIDEAQKLDRDLSGTIKSMYDNNHIHSIGLVSLDTSLDISDSFKEGRIGNRQIEMPTMELEEAHKMVEKRLENHSNPFPEKIITHLHREVNGSPRKILENLEELAMNKNPQEIQEIDVKEKVEETETEKKGVNQSEVMEKVTPTQKELLEAVIEDGELSAKELNEKHGIGSTTNSARSQADRLTDKDYLEGRDLPLTLLEKDTTGATNKYGLTSNSKRILAQD